jgi:hypothetical protein
MRKRLEELSWPTQPRSLTNENHGEEVEAFDSKSAEVVARPPISVKAQRRKNVLHFWSSFH